MIGLARGALRSGFRARPGANALRAAFMAAAFTAVASCVTAPTGGVSIPVELGQGELVEVWGVSANRFQDGVRVNGSATRRFLPNRPFNEHLHVEAINGAGATVEERDVPWNSIVSLRTKRSATFDTTFATSNANDIARVRLKVVSGAVHFTD